MGLFGFKKESGSLDKKLLKFLDEADKLYIKAYQTRSIVCLKDHFTRDCVMKLSRLIPTEAAQRMFINPMYSETKWSLKSVVSSTQSVYLKEVVCDKIKVSSSFKIGVGDDYNEEWTIDSSNKELLVIDVKLLRSDIT